MSPAAELLCLKALWSLQEGNVKEVRRVVAQSRPLAYTTIMTVLERLVRKGKLTRRKVGRAFVYSPEARAMPCAAWPFGSCWRASSTGRKRS